MLGIQYIFINTSHYNKRNKISERDREASWVNELKDLKPVFRH